MTSNKDLESRDNEQSQGASNNEQSQGASDDECTKDEGRMSIQESDKEPEQKRQKRIRIIGRAKQFKWLHKVREDGKLGVI